MVFVVVVVFLFDCFLLLFAYLFIYLFVCLFSWVSVSDPMRRIEDKLQSREKNHTYSRQLMFIIILSNLVVEK